MINKQRVYASGHLSFAAFDSAGGSAGRGHGGGNVVGNVDGEGRMLTWALKYSRGRGEGKGTLRGAGNKRGKGVG